MNFLKAHIKSKHCILLPSLLVLIMQKPFVYVRVVDDTLEYMAVRFAFTYAIIMQALLWRKIYRAPWNVFQPTPPIANPHWRRILLPAYSVLAAYAVWYGYRMGVVHGKPQAILLSVALLACMVGAYLCLRRESTSQAESDELLQ